MVCWAWEPQPCGARRRAGICGVAAPRRYHHIACVAAPCICLPGARAKMPTYSCANPKPERTHAMIVAKYRGLAVVSLVAACLVPLVALQQDRPGREGETIRLHSGWKITPAGTHETTGDMLLGCALSPDGRTLAMTNVGYAEHRLHLVDTAAGKIRQSLPLGRGWNGAAWSKDGSTIYVSGGASP